MTNNFSEQRGFRVRGLLGGSRGTSLPSRAQARCVNGVWVLQEAARESILGITRALALWSVPLDGSSLRAALSKYSSFQLLETFFAKRKGASLDVHAK